MRASDVLALFGKRSTHPLLATEIRPTDRRRRAALPREPEHLVSSSAGHGVGCTDCHDPHARWPPRREGDALSGELIGEGGGPVVESVFCFRCHGSSSLLAPETRGKNVESAFTLDAVSAHPLGLVPASLDLPGLRREAVADGRLSCSSCHGNDDDAGPRGPHGSQHAPLLVARYSQTDGQVESREAYALCYACHDRSALLGGDTRFVPHRLHVQENGASCHACHDAHGSAEQPHLLVFDREVVTPNVEGAVEFRQGPRGETGTCSLRCHGKEHVGVGY